MMLVDVRLRLAAHAGRGRAHVRIGPRCVALAVPVVVNGLGVAAMLALVLDLPFWASAVWVAPARPP